MGTLSDQMIELADLCEQVPLQMTAADLGRVLTIIGTTVPTFVRALAGKVEALEGGSGTVIDLRPMFARERRDNLHVIEGGLS